MTFLNPEVLSVKVVSYSAGLTSIVANMSN